MELGATTCKPTSPNCSDCPLAGMCKARILIDYAERNIEERNRIDQYTEIEKDNEIEGRDRGNELKKLKNLPKSKAIKSKIILKHDDISANKGDTKRNSSHGGDRGEIVKGFDESSGLNIEGCPVCISYFPQKLKKKEPKEIHFYVTVFIKKSVISIKYENGKIKKEQKVTNKKKKGIDSTEKINCGNKFLFLRRPDKGGLLANQWEFPNIIITPKNVLSTSTDAGKNEFSTIADAEKESVISRKNMNNIINNKGDNIVATNDDDDHHVHVAASRAFLRNTMGVDWLPYNTEKSTSILTSYSSPSSSSSSSCTISAQAVVEQSIQIVRNIGKRKFVKLTSDLDLSVRMKDENSRNSISDLKYVFTPSSPTLILPPIIHIFSHQKHIMHISLNEIIQKDGVEEDLPWESSCGEQREIRWMTKDEIIAAGITSGCKKILIESLKIME